jgi:ribosomal protein S12 methylthiotransferase accessory factor
MKARSADRAKTTKKSGKLKSPSAAYSPSGTRGGPIVFAGPSIGHEEILRIIPSADVRRPIRRRDLDAIGAGAVVAIIDGVFDAELSVSPREIRNALSRGVRVVGSSSMGALRASEIPQMLGVGRVYAMYRDGITTRDDEVAILLDNETGRALTEPLVNIRFAVSRLVSAGTLAASYGHTIVDTAQKLHFHDRTYRNILRRAGLGSTSDLETLVHALKSIDLKHEDAVSLLESLDDLASAPHWKNLRVSDESARKEYADDLDKMRIKRTMPADAPVRIWEFGELVDFPLLVRFLALTGRLDGYSRNAVLRFVLDGGVVDRPKKRARFATPSAQDLIDATAADWGWETPEEVHVTLRDLGFGEVDIKEMYKEEHESRRRLISLYEKMPSPFLRSLRFELLVNDLGLKREAMRLGALQFFAAGDEKPPAPDEIEEAKVALLSTSFFHRTLARWSDVLADVALNENDAAGLVKLLAVARRRGVPLLEAMDSRTSARASAGIPPGVRDLPDARLSGESGRSMSDEDAAATARKIGEVIGITRVAQIGELARIGGLHVTSAYRPSTWSSTISSGKSERVEGAVVGAVMEEVEKFCQETFSPGPTISKAFADCDPADTVDPRTLSLPFDSSYSATRPIEWTWAVDLVSGKKVQVPASSLVFGRLPNDIFFSPRLARKMFSTNGLASSLTLTEAISHAMAERIERHAVKLAEQDISNPGRMPPDAREPFPFVDLTTCPASTQRICEALRSDGDFEVRIMDITSDVLVPTFAIDMSVRRSSRLDLDRLSSQGFCTHPNSEIAINRAILEAVQCLLTALSGAREDMTINVQSLGRHERPRPLAIGAAYWLRPWVPKRPFSANPGVVNTTAKDDVAFMVNALTDRSYDRVLFRDLSNEKIRPAAAARVLIPGTEDVNPLHTGPRARARAVRDLFRKHDSL